MVLTSTDSAAPNNLDEPKPARAAWATSWRLAALLGVSYLLVSLVMDPAGYMGSDTGGKTATVAVMSERSDWSPDIGYWAEEWDAQGDLHPYFGTLQRGDSWVQVTSLPMIIAARPLWDLGGDRAVLLLPMLGSVMAALAAGRLSTRFGARHSWPTVLVVGLASPVAIYALDFWEHSIGLAAIGWAFVGVLSLTEPEEFERPSLRTGLLAAFGSGLAFGFAANLRQEALIYGFVAGLFLVASLYRRRGSFVSWALPGASMVFGTTQMLGANVWLEQLVFGEAARASRSAGSVSAAGSSGVALRLTEAAVTFASPVDNVHWSAVLLASFVAVGLIWATFTHINSSDMTRPTALLGLAVLALCLRLVTFGPGFVSGMLATTPLAGAGIAIALFARRTSVLTLAMVPLPLIWYFQYARAAAPQWGGRYILPTGLVLVAYAMSQRHEFGDRFASWAKVLMTASVAVTLVGLVFLSQRTHSFAEASELLANRTEPVMIFDDPFLPREAGPAGVHENWLAASNAEERAVAGQIVLAAGFDSFAYVGNVFDDVIEFDGFAPTTSEEVTFFEHTRLVKVTSYVRAG